MTVIIDNAIPDPVLSISELTEASLDGNGVLDVLLKTMRLHLQREFEANRTKRLIVGITALLTVKTSPG